MNQGHETVCINPATGETLGRWPQTSPDEVQEMLCHARAAQPAWAELPLRQRAKAILRVRNYLVEHLDHLAETISRDNGKTRTDAVATELLPAAMAADYYARHAGRFLRRRRLRPGSWLLANKRSYIRHVPWGVVGIVSPWNYPLAIPFSEVVMALLAGNAVVLKVASETQMIGHALKQCFRDADLPDGVFSYINMPGRLAGDTLLAAGIDKLFFTGSVAVGKELMGKAAQTLTPVCLELGGNDAMLVCHDANLHRAVAGAVWAGLQNCGQSCGGVERIYVHRDVYQPFLDLLGEKVRALRVGVDTDYQVDLGTVTTRRQLDTIRQHVDEALAAGATLFAQSPYPENTQGLFYPATVLTDVDHSTRVMREETFGPVLAVMPVDDMQQAVRLANDSDLGLTGSVWSGSRRTARHLAEQVQAGVVTINDHLMSHGLPETPWGGFKQSGIGRTHGALGFAEMTQPQCIVDDLLGGTPRNLWWHPHGPNVYRGLAGLIDMLYARQFGRRLQGAARAMRLLPRVFRRG